MCYPFLPLTTMPHRKKAKYYHKQPDQEQSSNDSTADSDSTLSDNPPTFESSNLVNFSHMQNVASGESDDRLLGTIDGHESCCVGGDIGSLVHNSDDESCCNGQHILNCEREAVTLNHINEFDLSKEVEGENDQQMISLSQSSTHDENEKEDTSSSRVQNHIQMALVSPNSSFSRDAVVDFKLNNTDSQFSISEIELFNGPQNEADDSCLLFSRAQMHIQQQAKSPNSSRDGLLQLANNSKNMESPTHSLQQNESFDSGKSETDEEINGSCSIVNSENNTCHESEIFSSSHTESGVLNEKIQQLLNSFSDGETDCASHFNIATTVQNLDDTSLQEAADAQKTLENENDSFLLYSNGLVPDILAVSSTPRKIDNIPIIFSPLSPIATENEALYSETESVQSSSEDAEENSEVDDSEEEYEQSASSSVLSNTSHVSFDEYQEAGNQSKETTDVFEKAYGWNHVKVYPGSELSINECILLITKLYVKNCESKAGLRRSVKAISTMLPDNHLLPSSDSILKYLQGLIPHVVEEIHHYCKECILYVEEKDILNDCIVCKKRTEQGDFYHFSLAGIVKYLFEVRNLASVLESAEFETAEANIYKDVNSGSEYKRINKDREMYDLTIILNADGVQLRSHSKNDLWLLLCTFVEIPIHLREAFLCVLGVWYDEVKPNMNTFLKAFCVEMEKISKEGIEWRHPVTGLIHRTYVRLQLVVADAPARAKMQNILAHNGKYGCCICEIRTVKCTLLKGMKKRIRVYPYVHHPPLRSKNRMLFQAGRALDRQCESVKGVKGVSVLSTIPDVDISKVFIPEFMHATLLGCTRQMVDIFLTKKGPWNIKKYIVLIDEDLAQIRHPDFVHRSRRQLKNVKNWKASDWYYFLLFEALPILKKYLPDKYYQHFILLVVPIYHLCKRNITEENVTAADLMLNLFVNQFVNLYPDRELSSNIHSLCHLALCVRRHGPLSCNSAFPFEGMNGTLAKATHGTYNVGQEIVNNIKIFQGIQILKKITEGLNDLSVSKSFSLREPLGNELVQIDLTPEEISLFRGKSFQIYSRAKIGCDIFTSKVHKHLKSANFHVMWEQKVEEAVEKAIGSVKFFAIVSGELCAFVNLYKIDHLNVIFNEETMTTAEHIIPITDTDEACLVREIELTSFVKVGRCNNYIFTRPNLLHQVM